MRLRLHRVPLLALAALALAGGLWTGLVRLGWALPFAESAPLPAHGPLMVSGFLGTLIGLERAVALDRRWGFTAPLLTGAGGIAVLALPATTAGPSLEIAGALVFVAVSAALARRQPTTVMALMGLGAACWLIGLCGWLLGRPVSWAVPWWAAFPVLTIVAERLELSRLVLISKRAEVVFRGAVVVLLTGLVLTGFRPAIGIRVGAVAMLVLALWLLRYDIARRRLAAAGLARFAATTLLLAYLWLAVAACIQLRTGAVSTGLAYDAAWHALFVGFVFGMIFAHGPIVFPSILGVTIPFRRVFYVHVLLLNAGLLLRLSGDATGWLPWRRWGAMLNAFAILLFLVSTAVTAAKAARGSQSR